LDLYSVERMMSGPDARELRDAIDELANALQGAVGQVAMLRQQMKTTCDYAFAVDVAIARAVTALKRLRPPSGPGRGER
jgi:hypothetical protein